MSASKVLDLAEQQGLLDAKVISELRRQVAESKFVVTPEAIAKILVDHGHLTPFQARKLVATALGEPMPAPPAKEPPAPSQPPPARSPRPGGRKDIPDELLLADDEGNPIPAAAPAPPEEEIIDLEPVAPLPKPQPQQPSRKPATPKPTPAPQPRREAPAPTAKSRPAPPPPAPAPSPAAEEEVIDLEPVPAPAPRPAPRQPARPAPPPASEDLVPLTPIPSRPVPAPAPRPVPTSEPALVPLPSSAPAGGADSAVATAPAPAAELKPADDLFGADPLANSALLGQPPAEAKPKKKRPTNIWDSPLLLLGGGGLGVMVIAFLLLLYSLTRGSAAELFAKAESDYEAGSYSSAIKGYETFLKSYPEDPQSSKARVRRGMAQLRQVTDGNKRPRQGLEMAKQVLPQIEPEENFNDARIELSSILPDIADGFATQANEATTTAQKEELVKLANEAMELVTNPSYIPASLRKDRETRIAGILDKLSLAQRSIDQDKNLADAVSKIVAAGKQGDAAAAYKVRADLLKVYPGLEAHPDLVAAIQQVGENERELVQVSQPATAAVTTERTVAEVQTTILAVREGGRSGGAAEPKPAFLLVDGSVYALQSTTGEILWRRHVGYQTLIHPIALAHDGGVDAVVVDGRAQDLLRLAGASGDLIWRQPIGEAFAAPVVSGEQIYVTTRKGRLLEIAAASGELVRQAQLPQGATMPVAVDSRQNRLLQLGEHSTLFALSGETLAGMQTFYLGHKTGAIFVPPVAVLDQVLIPESPGDDHTLIHVLGVDDKTKRLVEIGRPLRLRGRVLTPLAVSKRRVAALTDLGQVAVYEIDSTNREQPVRQIGLQEAGERSPVTGWCALEDNRLWTSGKRSTLLEVQASLQQIGRKWTLHQDDSFIGPMQVHGSTLIHLRRRQGWPGFVAEGANAADGRTIWATQLAVPIVAMEVSESRKAIEVLPASGRLFTLSGQQLQGGAVDSPSFSPPPGSAPAILPAASQSADGQTLIWTENRAGGHIFSYNIPDGGSPTSTPLPPGAAAMASAQAWGARLLVPMTGGSLALLDSNSGVQTVQPFLPPVTPDALPKWTQPAILNDETGCLVSDGRRAVYRVVLKSQPQAHLAAALEVPTESPISSSLVAAGGMIYGWSRGDAADAIVGFDPQALPNVAQIPLQGHVQAGPFAVGGLAFVAAEPEGLICIEAGAKVRWQKPLKHGPLAGSPLALADGDLLLIHQAGVVSRVAADTGEELGAREIDQPLGPAARVLGQYVFLSGSDGVLHRALLPARP